MRPKEIRLGPKEIRLRPKEREMRSVCALRRFVWAPLRHTIVSLTNKCMERLIRKASEKGVTHVRGGVIDATIVSSACLGLAVQVEKRPISGDRSFDQTQ